MAGLWHSWKALWKRAVLRAWLIRRPIGAKWEKRLDALARKRSIGPRRRARACGCIHWRKAFETTCERWAAVEVPSDVEPDGPVLGAGNFHLFVLQPVAGGVGEKVAVKKTPECRPFSGPASEPRSSRLQEEAGGRAILRADLLVASDALVFDFSAIEFRSNPGRGGSQLAGRRSRWVVSFLMIRRPP